MPIYEYECLSCGSRVEAIQKISDESLTTCEKCSGKLQKLISQSAFHLKGGGWYVTDYAKGSGQGSSPAASSESPAPTPAETPAASTGSDDA